MGADLAWYVHRLRAMSPAEVGHRLVERGLRESGRRRTWETAFPCPPGPLPAITVAREALAGLDPAVVAGWRAFRAAFAAGSLTLLDATWPIADGAPPWHRDPVTGRDWPAHPYCFDVPYRGDPARGDVKYVWELNRLQFVPPLAALSVLDRDDALADTCWTLVESWIDSNPPFRGVAWASGIELALRSVSLLLTLGLIGADKVPARLAAKLGACLSAHLFWLARYPSRHSSANNHLVAEAAGLFLVGTLWPAHPDAARHAASGRTVLVEEARRQIHADGIGAEQSPSYTALTAEWYLLAASVARRAGAPLPESTIDRVVLAADALRWFLDASGAPPRIGDDDDSHVVPSGAGHEARYVASVAAAAAAVAGRADLVPPGVRRGLREVVLDASVAPAAAPRGTRVFPDGGYTVHRGTIGGRDALLAFDHGPLGHLSIAAHGHADALAVWLHLDGEPVFIDAGTFLYHASDGWRDRFRGTAAHNTLVLGGADQSLVAGAFNWRRAARARLLNAAPDGLDVEAEHDGYARRFGLLCRRRIVGDREGFMILDRLVPAAPRRVRPRPAVAIGFLLHPALRARRDGHAVVVGRDGGPVLRLSPTTALVPRLEQGTCSLRFGHREPATRVVFVPEADDALAFGLRIDVAAAEPAPARGTARTLMVTPA